MLHAPCIKTGQSTSYFYPDQSPRLPRRGLYVSAEDQVEVRRMAVVIRFQPHNQLPPSRVEFAIPIQPQIQARADLIALGIAPGRAPWRRIRLRKRGQKSREPPVGTPLQPKPLTEREARPSSRQHLGAEEKSHAGAADSRNDRGHLSLLPGDGKRSHPLQMLPKSAQVQRHANSGTSAFAT